MENLWCGKKVPLPLHRKGDDSSKQQWKQWKLNEVLTISKITKIVLFREDSGYFQIDMNCMKIVNNKMQVFKTHGIFRHGIKLWHREMEYTKCKTIRSRTVFKLFL